MLYTVTSTHSSLPRNGLTFIRILYIGPTSTVYVISSVSVPHEYYIGPTSKCIGRIERSLPHNIMVLPSFEESYIGPTPTVWIDEKTQGLDFSFCVCDSIGEREVVVEQLRNGTDSDLSQKSLTIWTWNKRIANHDYHERRSVSSSGSTSAGWKRTLFRILFFFAWLDWPLAPNFLINPRTTGNVLANLKCQKKRVYFPNAFGSSLGVYPPRSIQIDCLPAPPIC